MAYIELSTQKISEVKRSVEVYRDKHRGLMNTTYFSMIDTTSNAWQGEDATAFRKDWEETVYGNDSTSVRMLVAMENYIEFLRVSQSKYEQFANTAVSRARSIPSWGI